MSQLYETKIPHNWILEIGLTKNSISSLKIKTKTVISLHSQPECWRWYTSILIQNKWEMLEKLQIIQPSINYQYKIIIFELLWFHKVS
jgi:hypothetical protein